MQVTFIEQQGLLHHVANKPAARGMAKYCLSIRRTLHLPGLRACLWEAHLHCTPRQELLDEGQSCKSEQLHYSLAVEAAVMLALFLGARGPAGQQTCLAMLDKCVCIWHDGFVMLRGRKVV